MRTGCRVDCEHRRRGAASAGEAQRALSLLDLMVYAVAKERGEALLFTGRDFMTTDVVVHPASHTD